MLADIGGIRDRDVCERGGLQTQNLKCASKGRSYLVGMDPTI